MILSRKDREEKTDAHRREKYSEKKSLDLRMHDVLASIYTLFFLHVDEFINSEIHVHVRLCFCVRVCIYVCNFIFICRLRLLNVATSLVNPAILKEVGYDQAGLPPHHV